MNRSQVASLLIATGIFIPVFAVPFADGYRRNAGLIEGIQSMSLCVMPSKYVPEFQETFTDAEVGLGRDENANPTKTPSAASSPQLHLEPINKKRDIFDELAAKYQNVRYGNLGKNVRFDQSVSENEIKNILRAGKDQIERSKSRNVLFIGWTLSRSALRLPFSFLVGGSLLLSFAGVITLILSPRQSRFPK